jgi:hypothetical protein
VKAYIEDATTTGMASAICAQGQNADDTDPPNDVVYQGNTLLGNKCLVRLSDSYAAGGGHQFRDNTFIRLGSRADYHSIVMGYWIRYLQNNRFIDSHLTGVDLEDNEQYNGPVGARDYSVGHSLWITALGNGSTVLADDSLRVTDNTGTNYRIKTDANGLARIELLSYAYVAAYGEASVTRVAHSGHVLTMDGFPDYTVGTGGLWATSNNESSPVTLHFGDPAGSQLFPIYTP